MDRPTAMGHLLAERHRAPADVDPDRSLLNYAESSRVGDWSLRSAAVRLAQPHPMRASAVVELVRRLDAALHPMARTLLRHGVETDRVLGLDSVSGSGHDWTLRPPAEPVPDARVTDLARLQRRAPDDFDAIVGAYTEEHQLDGDEVAALPLLDVALDLDELADLMAGWADQGFRNPPLDQIDEVGRVVFAKLEALGVPRESGPPGRRNDGA